MKYDVNNLYNKDGQLNKDAQFAEMEQLLSLKAVIDAENNVATPERKRELYDEIQHVNHQIRTYLQRVPDEKEPEMKEFLKTREDFWHEKFEHAENEGLKNQAFAQRQASNFASYCIYMDGRRL